MLANLLARRGLARAALAGLGLGFAVLAGLSLWATVSGQRSATDLRGADQTRGAWDQTLVLISTENEALFDYGREPDAMGVEFLASTVGSATPTLAWLTGRHDPGNAREVKLVADTYLTFTASLKAVVAAGRRGDHPLALAKAGEASLSVASLRKQLNAAIEVERLRLGRTLDQANRHNQRLRNGTLVALGIDLVLLSLCAAMLLRYQRRIERHAQHSSHRAMHDSLTGLPNRTLFDDRLQQAVAAAAQTAEQVALLMVDLDGFKDINDTLGHHHGDVLLKVVAERLSGTVRATDTVARLGGDEFAALLTHIGSLDQAESLAWRILDALREPADLDGETVRIGASIGIAICPEHGGQGTQLLRSADAAMYAAKRGERGVVVYPGPDAGAGADGATPAGRNLHPAAHQPGGEPAQRLFGTD
jgi:diguanylate cyclase (GGDEF)-like protein